MLTDADRLRLKMGNLSQSDLSRQTGIQPETISRILKGERKISKAHVVKFVNVLGGDPAWWLGLADSVPQSQPEPKPLQQDSSNDQSLLAELLQEVRALRLEMRNDRDRIQKRLRKVERAVGYLGVTGTPGMGEKAG